MEKTVFGCLDGRELFLFRFINKKGMSVTLSNFGALIVSLEVPDKNGKIADVALGYDTLEEYCVNESFFGAIIGPNANRIGGAEFTLDGTTYRLDKNDGVNNLHSHREKGIHKRIWDYDVKEDGVVFTLKLADGEMGFGGNKDISVCYTLTEDNELKITYDAQSDKNTVINMTNHCYFNLDGHGAGEIKHHKLQLFASAYTPVSSDLIPTGDILRVEGTPLDFRKMQTIGARMTPEMFREFKCEGYDHNWVCDNYTGAVRKIASVINSDATRTMEVYTDLPGVQIYTGNMMKPEKGKNGAEYDRYGAFAMETQFFPDSVNKLHFPSPIFGPGRPYHSTTVYRFEP